MKVVCDVEANALENPTKIWVIVCKDIDTNQYHIFRKVSDDKDELERFKTFASGVTHWIGHHFLGYDYPVIVCLCNYPISNICDKCTDTLIVSKLADYSRKGGHSIEQYGEELDLPKGKFTDFSKYTQEMEDYCVRDVDICHSVYRKYLRYILDSTQQRALSLEHRFQLIVNSLHGRGFAFDTDKARKILSKIEGELGQLDKEIAVHFTPKEVVLRTFIPKATKFGTINKSTIPKQFRDRIHEFEVGKEYPITEIKPFNPSSHKQIVDVLTEAGWKPVDKTETYKDTEREISRLKHTNNRTEVLDTRLEMCHNKLQSLEKYGWKINENNLSTLPPNAPSTARSLAKRILLESRRRSLTEWLGLVCSDNRIRSDFYGIGAWTHRMAHQHPNVANIPGEFREDGSTKLYGKEMRSLWRAPKNRLLIGVDAEGIQLRIFAHYIDDKEFTDALVNGSKKDKTDPHSLNQRIMGRVCKTRQASKRFIYALLLGAGLGKLGEILGCSSVEARIALDRILERYQGFAYLKNNIIPMDAKRGYFVGLDGRLVRLPGETEGTNKHLCMSGYLQNGEAIIMKMAAVHVEPQLKQYDSFLVNMVHDEDQIEGPNDMSKCLAVASIVANSITWAGEQLNLKCPLSGSYYNEDHKDYTIGTNWYSTH